MYEVYAVEYAHHARRAPELQAIVARLDWMGLG